jgi:hypothetical protein
VQPVPAGELVARLVPVAAEALVAAGVEAEEAGRWLSIIERRAASGQTGSRWQRQAFAVASAGAGPEAAGSRLVAAYLERAASGRPVHEWEPL